MTTAGIIVSTILYALISAAIGAYIGERRGVKMMGFFLGLFLGFIGWFIIMCVDDRPTCPACGSKIKGYGAYVCAACGRDIRDPVRPPAYSRPS